MAIYPQPKPAKRLVDRVAAKRERDRKAQAFRNAVWKRDCSYCRACGRFVLRTLELLPHAGHVHHRRGRNVAPQDRYNIKQAVLLCKSCHGDPAVIQRFRR